MECTVRFSQDFSFFFLLRMQPCVLMRSVKCSCVSHQGNAEDYTQTSSVFLLELFQLLKQMETPLHASCTQTQRGKGWRVNFSLFSNLTSLLSLIKTHAHMWTFTLLPGYTVSFWEGQMWVLSASGETTAQSWLEKWLWQYLNRNYDCLC